MDLKKRLRNARRGNRAPAAPTVAQMTGNMPGANWGNAFNPATGTAVTGGTAQYNNGIAPRVSSGRAGGPAVGGVVHEAWSPDPNAPSTAAFTPATEAQATGAGYVPAGSQVTGNEQGRLAALTALGQMQDRATTGWSQLDRQALDAAQRQAGQYEQAQRGANMQSMAARGMRGSGLEMLGAMTAQQSGADRALDAATQLGVAGRDRAMENTAQAANLGLGIDTQQFGQGMANAGNLDAFNQFATGTNLAATNQGYANALGSWQASQQAKRDRRDAIIGGVTGGMRSVLGAFGGFGGGGGGSGSSGGSR